MRSSSILLGLASLAAAQNMSICDKYTTALLKTNNGANQYTLLTLVVNTALIGNYTQPNVGIAVTGILNPGMYNGTAVNLLPYFDGELLSTNRGGSGGVAVNFLDDGGAAPLMKNMPSNGNQTSNQYKLITHLYGFFGALLGCSDLGQNGFPAYAGSTAMGTVHKFMDLDAAEMGYFITQVGTAAASFGVTTDDVTAVGMALQTTFGMRCAPPASVPAAAPAALQAICQASDCPESPNATCDAYGNVAEPMYTNGTTFGGAAATGSSTSTAAAGSASASASSSKSAASPGALHGSESGSMFLITGLVGLSALMLALML